MINTMKKLLFILLILLTPSIVFADELPRRFAERLAVGVSKNFNSYIISSEPITNDAHRTIATVKDAAGFNVRRFFNEILDEVDNSSLVYQWRLEENEFRCCYSVWNQANDEIYVIYLTLSNTPDYEDKTLSIAIGRYDGKSSEEE